MSGIWAEEPLALASPLSGLFRERLWKLGAGWSLRSPVRVSRGAAIPGFRHFCLGVRLTTYLKPTGFNTNLCFGSSHRGDLKGVQGDEATIGIF